MNIAANTKISALIKENPAAIYAIASINKHFEKLRNPVLRKILASRVTIADAARIGGCDIEMFYQKLEPLGFIVGNTANTDTLKQNTMQTPETTTGTQPAYLAQLPEQNILTLDVCEDIATGNDPFLKIMNAVEEIGGNNALLIINTFEPTPLIAILKKKGYSFWTDVKNENLVYTYFWLEQETDEAPQTETIKPAKNSFEDMMSRFAGKVKRIDVRAMEMPQPMVTILGELEVLPADEALYVVHKRVPQFLLPQLEERGFNITIQEVGPNQVDLLIYK
ncbi:DUF2249 domain-containing protein [Pontibacter sp. KCTC 32443]|uniref:DUF2249 domain-containing protein n=1 Tax=Pontibacter TaxID=323449 RepID=UPI00164E27FF|nr:MULTISPECIES: DUF2249 domain-containing protein [Pontibacter]MBC5774722.1 DUF2249 domain-containing protein [Pontibacter sp. KCTC 32443]